VTEAMLYYVLAAALHADPNTGPLGPLGWNEPTWVSAGSIAGVVVAIATLVLAVMTWRLASATTALATETKDLVASGNAERDQVERHHQQSLTPLVVLDADCIPDGLRVRFVGKIRNIGLGPATGVYICVKPDVAAPAQRYGRGLAAGDAWDFELYWDMGRERTGLDLLPYDCIVCFTSMFVTEGFIQQYSPTGRRLDLTIRQMILPERSKPGEIAKLRNAYVSTPMAFAQGEMGPR